MRLKDQYKTARALLPYRFTDYKARLARNSKTKLSHLISALEFLAIGENILPFRGSLMPHRLFTFHVPGDLFCLMKKTISRMRFNQQLDVARFSGV
jgi:hypothetical protein